MYILNEENYIKNIIISNEIPTELTMSYLITLLAKYYFDKKNDSKDLIGKVKEQLLEFNIENYQEYKWHNKIKKVCEDLYDLKKTSTFKKLEYIPIYQKEINLISSLPNDRQKKFMFTLFAVARYMDSNGWINKKDITGLSEIFKLANVTLTLDKKKEMLHELYANGYINFGKKVDNLNIQVKLSNEDDDIVYKITDFANIGNQYIGNFKKGYKQCKCCGKKIKYTNNKKMYCEKCAEEKHLISDRNYHKTVRN